MIPEINKLVDQLIRDIEVLCLGYEEAQLRCLSRELTLPCMSRLLELDHALCRLRLREIRRFQATRGVPFRASEDLKSIPFSDKPIELLKSLLLVEKSILHTMMQLAKLATEKTDMELAAFVNTRLILGARKLLQSREKKIRAFSRATEDDLTPMLVEALILAPQVTILERQLRFEMERRCWTETGVRTSTEELGFNPNKMIEANKQF